MANISNHLKALGDPVRRGQSIGSALSADRLNAIMGLLRAVVRGENLIAGVGLRKSSISEGVMLSGGAPGSGATTTHPFKVINASSGTTPKISVVFGQVNSVTPTISGAPIDASPADLPKLTVATGVVYLAVVLNSSGAITSTSIHNDAMLPEMDATHGYLTLAIVEVVEGKISSIRQSVTHSLGHQKCGARHNFWGL